MVKAEQKVVVITSTLDFGQITGINEIKELNAATVEYTLSRTVTPFGRLAFKLQPSTFSADAITFKKYDDGWRIEQ